MNIETICKSHNATYLKGEPIAPYTSFKIGGKCDIVIVNGVDVLREVLAFCKSNGVLFRILGRGSNVLISDKGLSGVVLLFGDDFGKIRIDHRVVECQAGAKLSNVCKAAAEAMLTGLEFAYGIPGSIGGALYMNAGAYGGEMAHVVCACEYFDVTTGRLAHCELKDMKLSYRHSVFCESNGERVITKVRLCLDLGSVPEIKARMDEISAMRKEKQPLEFPSAGSTFKRPEGYFAAKLIDDCGLKGRTVGKAQVSEKHSGFIINKGGATFDEVKELIEVVKNEVYAKTGVLLEKEVLVWGD